MKELLGIAVMGAIGSLARYGLASAFPKQRLHWATLVINATGCFLFGLVLALFEKRQLLSEEWKTILLVGFMGAFTTYSTFASDALWLIRTSEWGLAALYVGLHVVVGIALVRAGMAVVS